MRDVKNARWNFIVLYTLALVVAPSSSILMSFGVIAALAFYKNRND